MSDHKIVEASGNTKVEAITSLHLKCDKIIQENKNMVTFSEIRVYGNSELGYKVLKDYIVNDL